MYTDVSVVGLLAAEKLTTAGLQVDCIHMSVLWAYWRGEAHNSRTSGRLYTDLSVVGLLAAEKLTTAGLKVDCIQISVLWAYWRGEAHKSRTSGKVYRVVPTSNICR